MGKAFLCLRYCAVEYFFILLAIVSTPVYVFFVYVLVKNRKHDVLGKAFFKLCTVVAIGDLGQAIFFTGVMLPAWGLWREWFIENGPLYFRIVIPLQWVFSWVQPCGVMALTVNRFTALVFPIKHMKIWSNKWAMPTAIALQWLPPIATMLPWSFVLTTWEAISFDNNTLLGFVTSAEDVAAVTPAFLASHYTSLGWLVAYLVMYTLMAVAARRHSTAAQHGGDENAIAARKMEARLASTAVFLVIQSTFGSLLNLTIGEYLATDLMFVYFRGLLINVNLCCANPYIVLFSSSIVRKECLRAVGHEPATVAAVSAKTKSTAAPARPQQVAPAPLDAARLGNDVQK